ncbi:MAG TPA: dicarboxylate/amino acid:cation symporter, partial [bacterium]|nr:dicarboxylate/amino acid:cation symporter [bacterium]
PRNMMQAVVTMQMLPIIVLALLFGVMMTRMKNNHMDSVKNILEAVNEFAVGVVDLAMRFAPMAVPCLVFSVSARFGVSVLKPLGFYVILVFAGYILHLFGTYSLVLRLMAGINPLRFFQAVKPVMVTAFSTSSSNATLPTTIRVTEEELKISPNICGFVLPLGATTNMNGTALYEGLTVLFLAEIFGVDLTLGQQAFVVVMTVLTAIGTAGIPGGSLPMIVLVLQSVNVPAEGIGIILGVDRILDMGRTVLNVTGDITAAAYIAKTQGEPAQFNEA